MISNIAKVVQSRTFLYHRNVQLMRPVYSSSAYTVQMIMNNKLSNDYKSGWLEGGKVEDESLYM
jgi:hypothetical protein